MKIRGIIFGWAMLAAAGAGAQTAPATGAKDAGGAAPDFSTPRGTLTAVYRALWAGDIAGAKGCLLFQDAKQAELFELSYTPMYGPFRLMHVMEGRFGPAGRAPFANAALEKSLEALLEKVKTEEIRMDRATAVVAQKKADINPSAESELTGITLKEQGTPPAVQWKIVASTFGDATSELPAGQLAMMRSLRSAVETACTATGARVAAGDFKTADEAYADYQERVQAAMRAATPTTGPAR